MMTIFPPIVSQNYLIHSLKSVILSWRISVCDNNYMYPCFHVSFKYHVESYLIVKKSLKKKHFVITENCVLNARVIINASKAHGTREPMENIFIYTNLPSQVTHKWEKVRERESMWQGSSKNKWLTKPRDFSSSEENSFRGKIARDEIKCLKITSSEHQSVNSIFGIHNCVRRFHLKTLFVSAKEKGAKYRRWKFFSIRLCE